MNIKGHITTRPHLISRLDWHHESQSFASTCKTFQGTSTPTNPPVMGSLDKDIFYKMNLPLYSLLFQKWGVKILNAIVELKKALAYMIETIKCTERLENYIFKF